MRASAYARLVARARKGDAAAGPVVGLIAASLIYLLLFAALLGVTNGTSDPTRTDHRVLQDRAESSLTVLLGGTGEAELAVTANPHLLLASGVPVSWTKENQVTASAVRVSDADYTKLARSSHGQLLTSPRAPITPDATYVVRLAGYVDAGGGPLTADVVWYKDASANQAVRTDSAALSLSGTAPDTTRAKSQALAPPPEATVASIVLHGKSVSVNYTALEAPDLRSWEANPDRLSRFGLLEENLADLGFSAARVPNVLDYTKMSALRRGGTTSAANGAPDYPDVRTALGLGDTYQFHLRTYPLFPSLAGAASEDESLEVAYLGHFDTTPAPGDFEILAPASGPGNPPAWVEFTLRVTNGGSADMAYRIETTLDAQGGGTRDVVDNVNTPLVPPAASTDVKYRVYGYDKLADWKLGTTLRAKLHDARSNLLADKTLNSFPTPQDAGNKFNVKIEPAKAYFLTTSTIEIFFDHFDGSGNRLNQDQTTSYTVKDATGATVQQGTVTLPKNKAASLICSAAACKATGAYTVSATVGARTWSETYVVLASAPAESYTETGSSKVEAGVLDSLLKRFTNSTNRAAGCDASLLAGDKYIDSGDGAEALIDRLLRPDGTLCYHAVVVGSSVRHSAMTSAKIKYGFEDWVQAGGTLIVLGSESQSVQWLQPLGAGGLRGASGGIGAPDSTHPLLNSPEPLAYKSYRDPGRAWELSQQEAEDYTHVLKRTAQQGGGSQVEDMLAVSKPGVFGRGTVVLSAYMPFDLLEGDSEEERAEAARLMHNLVSQAYTQLYVDFGPEIPPGTPVASAARLVLVPHPLVPGALLQVEVLAYVWRG